MNPLALRIPPLAVVAVAALAIIGAARAAPALAFRVPGQPVAAAILVLAGGAVAAAGVASFRHLRTTVNPMSPERASALATGGIYRYSRNPMYLGLLAALAGLALWVGNALSLAVLPAFVAYMNQFQIKPEETALLSRFGEPYARYRASVRRWI
ncbi:isoprenylcysteine carboxylmethyltransferase family protein [Ramlibacter sp.]|uniref:methyltransferase family protein n=1 Tax=Ramlibacter sp. TaxID=1917967 RepID=UPI002B86F6DF|nr:isoprenylcysteine carboxylmethyltransferase family protein [Ramlibacter sp.]HWI81962.1 isoprenylcysteine carboxylmethyltransferase family protein [Ramlibacter sp.]